MYHFSTFHLVVWLHDQASDNLERGPTWNHQAEVGGCQQGRVVALNLGAPNQDVVPASPVVLLCQAPQFLPDASRVAWLVFIPVQQMCFQCPL